MSAGGGCAPTGAAASATGVLRGRCRQRLSQVRRVPVPSAVGRRLQQPWAAVAAATATATAAAGIAAMVVGVVGGGPGGTKGRGAAHGSHRASRASRGRRPHGAARGGRRAARRRGRVLAAKLLRAKLQRAKLQRARVAVAVLALPPLGSRRCKRLHRRMCRQGQRLSLEPRRMKCQQPAARLAALALPRGWALRSSGALARARAGRRTGRMQPRQASPRRLRSLRTAVG